MKLFLACLTLFAAGCVLDELTTPHVEPGGQVMAAMDSGPSETAKGIGHALVEPLTIDGFSGNLTFGIVAQSDENGASVRQALAMPTSGTTITVVAGSPNRLEIHLNQTGCVATMATIHLQNDSNGLLSGDFSGSGTVSGAETPCTISGALMGIPVER